MVTEKEKLEHQILIYMEMYLDVKDRHGNFDFIRDFCVRRIVKLTELMDGLR